MFNPYFWFLAFWALWITPVRIDAGLRLEKGVSWRAALFVSGIMVAQQQKQTGWKQENGTEDKRLKNAERIRLVQRLWRDGSLSAAGKTFSMEQLWVQANVSFADAAATALSYALLRTIADGLVRFGGVKRRVSGRITADFQASGTQLEIRGIFSARLGRVALTGIRLGIAVMRTRARLAMEEEQYAAASH